MSRHEDLQQVLAKKLVAIIRAPSSEQLNAIIEAIYGGGIDIIEVTMTVPNALEIISRARKRIGDKILLGAGTVLDPETARSAILAGAEFIVSPIVNLETIRLCNRYDKLIMPGALTPTEIMTAWDAGAELIKVFPAESGGPGYLKAIKGPFPQVKLIPTGGVTLDTMHSYLDAGASAVGLGSSLIEKNALAEGNMTRFTELASLHVECRNAWQA